jgi:carbon-monoxide dehydrogenase large subunit
MPRKEDGRLLAGRGQYVSDLRAPGMLAAGFVRAPHAHARMRAVDLSAARACPGVALAIAGSEAADLPPMLDASGRTTQAWLDRVKPRLHFPRIRPLARDIVRYVGEPVAVVVGRDRYAVEDAIDAARIEYEPLPPVVDVVEAAKPEAPKLHADLPDNILFDFRLGKGDAHAAIAGAPHKLSRRFRCRRNSAVPMEGRGCLAVPDERTGSLTVYTGCQQLYTLRAVIAAALGLDERLVRVVVPDVGGGFGGKNGAYPEDVAVAYAAYKLGRPIRWLEDRRENLLSMNQGRDQVLDATIAFDGEGRALALQVEQWLDSGAYQPLGPVVTYQTATHVLGPYQVPNLDFHGRSVATNKAPNAPYRGAGRPEAAFIMDALLDDVARELRLDPAVVRERNLVPARALPYNVGIPFRDGADVVYDSGDYPELLRRCLEAGEYRRLRQRQSELRRQGRFIGLGISCYVEATGTGPFEGATVALDPDGNLLLMTGACSQGQGHETSLAEIMSELWDVPPERINVLLGDTGRIAYGAGTYASRTLQLVSAAVVEATAKLHDKLRGFAAGLLEANPSDLQLDLAQRVVHVRGDSGRAVSLAQLARAAGPGWGTGGPADPGLQATAYYAPESQEWASAAHLAVVEVDPETGGVTLERYVICHDAGRIVSPVLADGQMVGGVATGVGGALLEELAFDESGQPLTTSLMDYLLPAAVESPLVDVLHLEIPSPVHPLGIKGLGEGGTVGAPAAIANAVADAVGVEVTDLPVTPERLWRLLMNRRSPAGA